MADLEDLGQIYNQAGVLAAPRNLDLYNQYEIQNPAISTSWFGTVSAGTASTNAAIVLTNAISPQPRNAFYTILGVSGGTFGGTFTANWYDQFGSQVREKVVVANSTTPVGIYGTAIVAKFISGTFQTSAASGGSAGTAQIGFGTVSNGSAQSNWFGLLQKIGGTADVKLIGWSNNGAQTTLNKGTNFGTLVNATTHSFQGTSGVAATDQYNVILKSSYSQAGKPKSAAL